MMNLCDDIPNSTDVAFTVRSYETGIDNHVTLPTARPVDDVVDVYGATNLHDFVKVKSVDVSGCASNALVTVSDIEVSGVGTNSTEFRCLAAALKYMISLLK